MQQDGFRPRRDQPTGALTAKRAGHATSAGNIHQVRAKYDLDEDGNVVKKGAAAMKTQKGAKPAGKKGKSSRKAKRGPKVARPRSTPTTLTTATHPDAVERTLKAATVEAVLAYGTHRAQAVVEEAIATIRATREA